MTVSRHVAVMGGSGGIGRAIARRFAREDTTLYLLGRNVAKLQEESRALATASGTDVRHVVCDAGDPVSLSAAIGSLPALDVWVNAAGSISRRPLLDTTPELWRTEWADKVLGTIEAVRLASDRMKVENGGVIINIIGTAGVRLNPKTIMTTTANAALIAFTQAFGSQSVDFKVRVVGINPGLTETPRTQALAVGKGGNSYKALLDDLPFGRMGKAEEIADCAWFLASDHASYISGTVIDVDAGARWRI